MLALCEAEEELELNAKAMGAVIGKGGKGIKEIEQATGRRAHGLGFKDLGLTVIKSEERCFSRFPCSYESEKYILAAYGDFLQR